jgi:DNA-directed RNA polymerase specialized sigma24 family protein
MYRAPDPYYHDFLDLILDDVDWFHHMVEDADVSANIGNLLKMQKEVLYLYKVRVLKMKQIAALLGKTDRTIRKRRALLLARLRERLALRITARMKSGPPITPAMRKFIENYGKEGGA